MGPKEVVYDSPGLVDCAIGLVDSDHHLLIRESEVFLGIKITKLL